MTEAIVIDTSSILRMAKDNEDGERERQACDGKRLYAPESVRWELVNGLAQGVFFARKEAAKASPPAALRFTPEAAQRAYRAANTIPITFVDIDRKAALNMALSHSILSYDAFVLQCAIETGLPLLTSESDKPGRMPHFARLFNIPLVEM